MKAWHVFWKFKKIYLSHKGAINADTSQEWSAQIYNRGLRNAFLKQSRLFAMVRHILVIKTL